METVDIIANHKKSNNKYRHSKKGKATQWRYRKTIKGYLIDVFNALQQRCNNPNHPRYKDYGAKGIKCLFKSSDKFINYVISLGYDTLEKIKGLQIHRTKKHYEKGGIVFITDAKHRKIHKN